MNYWEECVAIALEECGLVATKEQLECIAGSVEVGHENYGMAHGYDVIGNPVESEAKRELAALKRKNREHEDWVLSTAPCKSCTTSGQVKDGWGRDQTCFNCDGKGRVSKRWG